MGVALAAFARSDLPPRTPDHRTTQELRLLVLRCRLEPLAAAWSTSVGAPIRPIGPRRSTLRSQALAIDRLETRLHRGNDCWLRLRDDTFGHSGLRFHRLGTLDLAINWPL